MVRRSYTYLLILIQEFCLDNLGAKSSEVGMGKVREDIKKFPVCRD